ncbi:hypothetical protein Pan44_55720 [Caulifigura coniformis]|uniref:Uncharacterized protein n=1 Tax=Caulifigura coniformis TaxID=2527983 RepID=A0A517SN04_9PLAN|nr:hypothetical protein [Caulifigura coniformis]QDT57503.1 hypothetical protein Pan44_55720 [Caulifigura coniformis]
MTSESQGHDWNAVKCVITPSAIGLAFFAVAAAFPNRDVVSATVGATIACTWSAVGIGLYGMVRYPSKHLLVATLLAIAGAMLSGRFFWDLAMTGFLQRVE